MLHSALKPIFQLSKRKLSVKPTLDKTSDSDHKRAPLRLNSVVRHCPLRDALTWDQVRREVRGYLGDWGVDKPEWC